MKATLRFSLSVLLEILLGIGLILFCLYVWLKFGAGKNPVHFSFKVFT
ncbi:MAG: hypothetical protein J7L45_00325 [Candidatus Aenigmarchaeota archaeon]|nr:hypothetical protein [Candidatus Aenigmarchaeota archaeon]